MDKTVTEKPILFSPEMVRAILDGTKTVTRRIMKPQPQYFDQQPHWRWKPKSGIASKVGPFAVASGDSPGIFGPWQTGQRLWVRETWRQWGGTEKRIDYRATTDVPRPNDRWRPSIHMPKCASRITLELNDVRVEQLGDMKPADVVAEGFPFSSDLDAFRTLWKKLNGAWNPETWVWVLSFRRLEAAK